MRAAVLLVSMAGLCVVDRYSVGRPPSPAGLDERRTELPMMPIGEYLKLEYIVPSCKKG